MCGACIQAATNLLIVEAARRYPVTVVTTHYYSAMSQFQRQFESRRFWIEDTLLSVTMVAMTQWCRLRLAMQASASQSISRCHANNYFMSKKWISYIATSIKYTGGHTTNHHHQIQTSIFTEFAGSLRFTLSSVSRPMNSERISC